MTATYVKFVNFVSMCIRFQATVKKFVKSMGDMEQRLQTLENNVENIQKKQESFHVNQQKDNRRERQPVNKLAKQDPNLAAKHKRETKFDSFVGYVMFVPYV